MAAAWTMTQQFLEDILNRYKDAHSGDSFSCHLFQNDYVPIDPTVLGDLEECDFDGYEAVGFDPADFGTATFDPYVAQIIHGTFLNFTADTVIAESQTAYGYFVLDGDDNLLWVERWEVPFLFEASSVLNMKPALRERTCRE